jgi:hypothetical protein
LDDPVQAVHYTLQGLHILVEVLPKNPVGQVGAQVPLEDIKK